ncbi:Selenoprotein [Dirofilaria immitis]
MPYVDSNGNIVESKKSTLNLLWHFFAFFLYFFQTLFGPLIGEARGRSPQRRHDRHRWSGNDRWPGSGGPGGPSRGGYGIGRRPIGRPTFSSGMSCPPMGGGS